MSKGIRAYDKGMAEQFPYIEWREPIIVNGRWACRLCIARLGLKEADVTSSPYVFLDRAEYDLHLTQTHRQ